MHVMGIGGRPETWRINVPELVALVTLIERKLPLQRQSEGLAAHLEHPFHLFLHAVVLEAVGSVGARGRERESIYILPEPQFCRSLPQFVYFILVSGLDELVVDHQEWVSLDVLGKGRNRC